MCLALQELCLLFHSAAQTFKGIGLATWAQQSTAGCAFCCLTLTAGWRCRCSRCWCWCCLRCLRCSWQWRLVQPSNVSIIALRQRSSRGRSWWWCSRRPSCWWPGWAHGHAECNADGGFRRLWWPWTCCRPSNDIRKPDTAASGKQTEGAALCVCFCPSVGSTAHVGVRCKMLITESKVLCVCVLLGGR